MTTSALLRAEWTKLTSVRSTLWATAAFVAATIAVSALVARNADPATAAEDPAASIFAGCGFGLLLVCVLGTLVVTSEYSTGTIRAGVLAVPRRTPLLLAKAVVFTSSMFVVGTLTGIAAFFVGASLLPPGVHASLDREVFGFGLYTAMLGLFAVAVGALVRHTAGALTVTIGMFLVVGPLASSLPGHLGNILPTTAGQALVQADGSAGISPWLGFLVFAAWTIVLTAVAARRLKTRDLL